MDTPAEPQQTEDFVQSFARGLSVICAFDAQHSTLTLSEVARRANVSPAAAGRLLRTLETLGYVRNDGRSFALTPRILELGFSYLSALSTPEILQPHLLDLSHEVGESVSAAVLAGTEIVYIARVPTRKIMSVGITVGTRFPAYATSMGRVLLAGLSDVQLSEALDQAHYAPLTEHTITRRQGLDDEIHRVREQGWALVDGELEVGLRSIAAPVRDAAGRVCAAINISMVSGAESAESALTRHLHLLLATAAAAEADLRLC